MYRGSSSIRNATQIDRATRIACPFFVCLIGLGTLNPIVVVFAAERCPASNATRVVSVQGNVTWSVINATALHAAKLNDVLCVGDTVRVGAKSRAVLRLPNETTVPLDQNTVFRLKQAIAEKDPTLIELIQGAIHVITRTPKPFKVETPYLNANVEGTEFYVGVDSGEARVAVIEGKVNVSNEQGAVLLVDNEAATARKGQAPQKTLTIKPRDAVQWALYYPPLFDPRSRAGGESLAASHERYSQGDITGAIESLDAVPEAQRNEDLATYRAGLLLLVGRADEAEPEIERALAENGNNTDALSLKAIIAIVKNDKAKALELANQAVNIDDKSASARIALSYALQANFKIEDALKAAREATLRDANNALAWARVAELELSIPDYDKSKEAAEVAVKRNPNLARTQSVLGFANLTRLDIKAAKESFNKAIELDQADPLPRLGLGLATIRDGNLEQGREQIEIAIGLDPEHSLFRSYLGKAYFEEKRNTEARKQFELAKAHDPNDPTPYYYDAIRKQTGNQPVEALQDLTKSTELNSNRAIFRSKLAIDEDLSTRGVSQARIYSTLGFDQLALASASKSVAEDPRNYSAHRFLSDAYAGIARHEIARRSELLQAKLLQSADTIPMQRCLAENNGPIGGYGHLSVGSGEFARLMDQPGPQFFLAGISGNQRRLGFEGGLAGRNGSFSYGASACDYSNEGFRPNQGYSRKAYELFGQYSFASSASAQIELRRQETVSGDLDQDFDTTNFSAFERHRLTQNIARIGLHLKPSINSDLILSGINTIQFETATDIVPDIVDVAVNVRERSQQVEMQYMQKFDALSLTMGGGSGHIKTKDVSEVTDFTVPISFTDAEDIRREQYNLYLYGHGTLSNDLSWTAGIAFESLRNKTSSTKNFDPKFGLAWKLSKDIGIRLAGFRTTKRAFVQNQTLETTTVAAFNQFFDDPNGTRTERIGIGIDARLRQGFFVGLELTRRKLEVPISFVDATGSETRIEKRYEQLIRAYVYYTITHAITLSVEPNFEIFRRDAIDSRDPLVTEIKTLSIPISFRVNLPNGIFASAGPRFVKQSVDRLENHRSAFSTGTDSFTVINAAIGYNLPKRFGFINLEVHNLTNEKFSFRDDNFRRSEPVTGNLMPTRTYWARGTLYF